MSHEVQDGFCVYCSCHDYDTHCRDCTPEREALASKLARIAELEAEVQKLQGVLRQLMATGLAVEALLADEPSSVYIHPGIWAKLKEHRGHLRRGLLMLRQERESE
jgi:hypothetical protein